ncbi:lipase 3-like [Ctenocephalides felis]|uniref:lipase 3-like n=1 Tax=Ctenocephalides felis TaxID=7515 RepID=UPI000E6E191C|nr:lipase 3-like [Ctenocephalides felis]
MKLTVVVLVFMKVSAIKSSILDNGQLLGTKNNDSDQEQQETPDDNLGDISKPNTNPSTSSLSPEDLKSLTSDDHKDHSNKVFEVLTLPRNDSPLAIITEIPKDMSLSFTSFADWLGLTQPFNNGFADISQLLVSAVYDLDMEQSAGSHMGGLIQQKTTTDLIQQYDYPHKTHHVTTEDGYILEMHRIPNQNKAQYQGVVFLMHGLLSSSADWVVIGPQKALGFLLHDIGFDVWMGNARGNKYSRGHSKLNSATDSEYWNFSWHVIGSKDLPAMLDYILDTTGEQKLTYVGHSQGTTSFWVMASEKPEYNTKIKSMQALAPVAFMSHVTNLVVNLLATTLSGVLLVTNLFGQFEFLPSKGLETLLGRFLCADEDPLQMACTNMYFIAIGYNPSQLNAPLLPEILNNVPAGASTKQFLHYGQLIASKKFRQYDHGQLGNLKQYGSPEPPEYDISKITTPVAFYTGPNDNLGDPEDAEQLASLLPNLVVNFLGPIPLWTHADFIYGEDVKELFYDKVIDTIMKYNV